MTPAPRAAHRGDQRRAALLGSLDEILRERVDLDDPSLESINIAEISRRAGVTRSAFYFYFENKQAAVAALMEEMYEAIATSNHLGSDGSPHSRITATISGLFDAWEANRHLFRAMLDARATSSAVRELWDSDRLSFVEPVAAMIAAERSAGRAPGGADPAAVASVLLELNDRMLERLAHGGDRAAIEEAVIEIWLRTVYGRTDQ
ncbi:TetR/AcrR family transcriptional regulator [Nocardioides sp. 503]|uniref:TetR/AcrR family transcriptional regulator n=1 Tax=Nocardioides sp. 503 TaxID=2508326 RepID=UPI001070000F|nr:TetR/AcrR family transcriptional regulator [Nocardioides sp. 503]